MTQVQDPFMRPRTERLGRGSFGGPRLAARHSLIRHSRIALKLHRVEHEEMKQLLTIAILTVFLLSIPRGVLAQTTNQYFNISFHLTSHEEVGTYANTRIVTRHITNRDLVFALLQVAGLQQSDLDRAKLLWRDSGDSATTGPIIKLGTNEVSVSQYLRVSYPQTSGYYAITAHTQTTNGVFVKREERIMQITFGDGMGSYFDVQGFQSTGNVSREGGVHTFMLARLAGGGHVLSPNGIGRDGVFEGTFTFAGPINAR
jgi:hypothetical protein